MLACCERAQMEYRGARSPSWQCEGYGTGRSCASPIRRHHQPLTSTARARRGCDVAFGSLLWQRWLCSSTTSPKPISTCLTGSSSQSSGTGMLSEIVFLGASFHGRVGSRPRLCEAGTHLGRRKVAAEASKENVRASAGTAAKEPHSSRSERLGSQFHSLLN